MEGSTVFIGILFFVFLIISFIWNNKRLFHHPKESIAPVVGTMGLISLSLPYILIGVIDPGLDALLYLYISSIMIILYWLITLFMLLVKYFEDKQGQFFAGNAILLFLMLLVIPLMWAIASNGGGYKFWG